MSKPKSYVGDTYSNPFDHGGKTYRWDHKKQEYVLSRGNSPIASIKRSWNQKIVPAAEQYAERQTRLTKEALNQKTPNINEYFNSILQERWDNATTEEEKASVKDLLASFNVGLEKDIIQSERDADSTSVIPESFSEYRGRTAGEMVQDDVTIPPSEKEVNKVESGVLKKEEPEEVKEPPFMSIADLEKWELDTRDTTPAGKAFGEEGAQQRMAIRRRHLENRGTIFEDNVRQ